MTISKPDLVALAERPSEILERILSGKIMRLRCGNYLIDRNPATDHVEMTPAFARALLNEIAALPADGGEVDYDTNDPMGVEKDDDLSPAPVGDVTRYERLIQTLLRWRDNSAANSIELTRGDVIALLNGECDRQSYADLGASGGIFPEAHHPRSVKVSDIRHKIALWSDDEGLDLSMGQGEALARSIAALIEPTPSTAGSVREALKKAHGQFRLIAATNCWTHNNLQGWQESPGALREFAEEAAKEIDAALRAHGGDNE